MAEILTVVCRRVAMATWFEFRLIGADRDHLVSVGEAALDEVSRIERLLSRHDPTSEVSRVNREAGGHPVRVDREFFRIVESCGVWTKRTEGYFDVSASEDDDSPGFTDAVRLDPDHCTIQFLHPAIRLDFGGFGKGCALDSASRILVEFGVNAWLIHGGTSSILARGRQADGSPFRIGLRDPDSGERSPGLIQLDVIDQAVSTSAAFDRQSRRSDVIVPPRSRPLDRQASCSVFGDRAVEAEIVSTALLAMGRRQAQDWLTHRTGFRVVWADCDVQPVRLDWLNEEARP